MEDIHVKRGGGRSLRGLGAEAGTEVTRYGEKSAWAKRNQKVVSFPTLRLGYPRIPWNLLKERVGGHAPLEVLLENYIILPPVQNTLNW